MPQSQDCQLPLKVTDSANVAQLLVKDNGEVEIGQGFLRVGTGGTNTNVTGAGDLYVQDALEVDGEAYLTTVSGAGLADCDNATTSKLLWDITNRVFSCGTDQSGGGSVTAGNDIDVTGSTVDIESQLDFVSVINRTSANLTLQTTTSGDIQINPGGAGDLTVTADSDSNVQIAGTVTSSSSNDLQLITLTNQSSSGTQRGLVVTNANDAANAITESLLTLNNAETTANTVTDYLSITSSATDSTANAINVSDSDLFNAIYLGANFARFDGIRAFEGATGTLTVEDTSGNDLISIIDNGTTGTLNVYGSETVSGTGVTTGIVTDIQANSLTSEPA